MLTRSTVYATRLPNAKPSSKLKIAKKSLFSCIYAKNVVILQPKVQRRGLEGGKCLLSESQIQCQIPQSWLSRHFSIQASKRTTFSFMAKRCPKRFVLGFTESGKFYFYSKTLQQLMSSGYVILGVCILGTRVRMHIRRGLRCCLFGIKGQYQSLVKRNSSTQSRFFVYANVWHLLMKAEHNSKSRFFVCQCDLLREYLTVK